MWQFNGSCTDTAVSCWKNEKDNKEHVSDVIWPIKLIIYFKKIFFDS